MSGLGGGTPPRAALLLLPVVVQPELGKAGIVPGNALEAQLLILAQAVVVQLIFLLNPAIPLLRIVAAILLRVVVDKISCHGAIVHSRPFFAAPVLLVINEPAGAAAGRVATISNVAGETVGA